MFLVVLVSFAVVYLGCIQRAAADTKPTPRTYTPEQQAMFTQAIMAGSDRRKTHTDPEFRSCLQLQLVRQLKLQGLWPQELP